MPLLRLDHPAPRSEHLSEMSPPPVTHKKEILDPQTGYLPRRIKLASFQAPTKSQKIQENEFELGLPSINSAHRAVSDQLALHLIPLLPAQCYALLYQPRQQPADEGVCWFSCKPGGASRSPLTQKTLFSMAVLARHSHTALIPKQTKH